MTDRKQRLRALDRLDTPDVWERARTLEPTTELDGPPEHAARKRMTVIVVAFAVFAAAGAFAWQGFRPASHEPTPVGSSDVISSTVLWPERTLTALEAAQASTDASDPATAWRLDPATVAGRFAEDVLKWGPVGISYQVVTQSGAAPSSMVVVVERFALPCPAPAPGTVPTCPPPYERETLTLRQEVTRGPSGIWSVTEVRADDLRVNLRSGQDLQIGASITGSVAFPDTASSVPGFSAVSGSHVGDAPGCGDVGGVAAHEGEGVLMTVSAPGAMASGGCGATLGGYVWVATEGAPAEQGAVVADPLDVTPSYLTFYGLTIVPIQVSLPADASPS